MNTKIIPADIDINKTIVTNLLHEQFDLRVHKLVQLGEGWDNVVYLVNDVFVFRFPRRIEAVALVEMEMRILPVLCDMVSLKIPRPIFFGKASSFFPRPFYGHEIIPGIPGSAVSLTPAHYEKLAIDVGSFLKNLHNISPKALGLPKSALRITFARTDFDVSLRKFKSRLKAVEQTYNLTVYQRKIASICANASHYDPEKLIPVLVHGDLYHRHLIFNQQNQLIGVIDWGDAGLADPVADLGIVYQFLPKIAHRSFFEAYGPVEDEALHYARFIGLYFAVALLWFGHDRKDQDLIKTSLRTLAII